MVEEKALLLYPGKSNENDYKSYETYDYSKDHEENPSLIDHQCKMGFIGVVDESLNDLDQKIGRNIIDLVELTFES